MICKTVKEKRPDSTGPGTYYIVEIYDWSPENDSQEILTLAEINATAAAAFPGEDPNKIEVFPISDEGDPDGSNLRVVLGFYAPTPIPGDVEFLDVREKDRIEREKEEARMAARIAETNQRSKHLLDD